MRIVPLIKYPKKWFFQKAFGLDLRSLALLRICLGLTIITDLILRSRNLTDHYTDYGIFPRRLLLESIHPWFSLHALSGDVYYETGLFFISGIAAFTMLIGYRTKLSVMLSWLFLLSLQHRNTSIVFGADGILSLIMFWALFLPLGEYFSADSLKRSTVFKKTSIFTAASFAYVLQIFMIYIFNFIAKSGPEWQDGSSVYYILHSVTYTTPIGKFLLNFPDILRFLSFATRLSEGIMPFLLLIPWSNWFFRIIFIVWMASMHIGFGLGLSIGIFTLVSLTMLTPLIPGEFWNYLLKHFPKSPRKASRTLPISSRSTDISNNFRLSSISSIIVLVTISYLVIWNMSNSRKLPEFIPHQIRALGYLLRLNQTWNFFALPFTKDGWIVIAGELHSGEKIDLLRNGEKLTYEKPSLGKSYYQDSRWADYFLHLANNRTRNELAELTKYFCKRWNDTYPINQHVNSVQIILMLQKTLPNYEGYAPAVRYTLANDYCSP